MSFDLVLFGGTGDLSLAQADAGAVPGLPPRQTAAGRRILAVARDERSDDAYRDFIRERFAEVEAQAPHDEEFARFAELLHYRRMDLSQPERLRRPGGDWLDARAPTPWCCSWPPARTCSR